MMPGELTKVVEALFTTFRDGEPRAYFEFDKKDGTQGRGIYRVYGFEGEGTPEEFSNALLDVFKKLRAQAGEEGHLYWRRPIEQSTSRINARFCVIDKDGNDVTELPDLKRNTMDRYEYVIGTDKLIDS